MKAALALLFGGGSNGVSNPGGGGTLFSSLGLNDGDEFHVMGGTVLIDEDTPNLGKTMIMAGGVVKPVTKNSTFVFSTAGIMVEEGGLLDYSTEADPCDGPEISLTGAYEPLVTTVINGLTTPTTADASNRGIMIMPGGRANLHGLIPTVPWTTLNANADATDTALTTAVATGWSDNDPIVVAPTDFIDRGGPEQFTLDGNASGTAITINAGLGHDRWGQLQYPTDAGLSLSPGTFSTKKGSADVPTILDERARVVNLKRGLVISCPNDSDWTDKGHGVVIMAMADHGTNHAILQMSGVQIRRGGQRSAVGRYPAHWHMMSYDTADGSYTADAVDSFIRSCVVWSSANRGITIHGTNGLEVRDNVCYDIEGHAIFQEDGVEADGSIVDNMVIGFHAPHPGYGGLAVSSLSGTGSVVTLVFTGAHNMYSGMTLDVGGSNVAGYNCYRNPVTVVNSTTVTYAGTGTGAQSGASTVRGNNLIKVHDIQASGYWLTLLDNIITGNYACGGASGNGVWFVSGPAVGLSHLVPINGNQVAPQTFAGCICHSNFGFGLNFSSRVIDEFGNIDAGVKYPSGSEFEFDSTDHILWKNSSGAYFNTTNQPRYRRWTVADNAVTDWQGSTNNGGESSDHLGVGHSFNNANTQPTDDMIQNSVYGTVPRAAFVSYHGTVRFFNNSWFNYAYATPTRTQYGGRGQGGGMQQGGWDFYDVAGVDTTMGTNTGNKLINTHPGPMVSPFHLGSAYAYSNPVHDYTVDVGIQANDNLHYGIAGVWIDLDGKWGTAGKYMLPFSGDTTTVDDYFLTGATNLADGPVGISPVVCKTTDTKFLGIGCSDVGCWPTLYTGTPVNGALTNGSFGSIGGNNPVTLTRQHPSTGATIGTPFEIKRGDTGQLGSYRNIVLQNEGRFLLEFKETNRLTFGITIASPAVVTYGDLTRPASHGLTAGTAIKFQTTGSLPTGITAGTTYYVIATGLTDQTFRFSATLGGSAVNTSGSQSGTHSYTYRIDPANSMQIVDVYQPDAGRALGDFFLIGIPWANGATPRVCYGSHFSNESVAGVGPFAGTRTTFASSADVTNDKAIICSASGVTSIADVLADTTGVKFWQDTTNNLVWVRFTNRNTHGGQLASNGQVFFVDVKTITVKV